MTTDAHLGVLLLCTLAVIAALPNVPAAAPIAYTAVMNMCFTCVFAGVGGRLVAQIRTVIPAPI